VRGTGMCSRRRMDKGSGAQCAPPAGPEDAPPGGLPNGVVWAIILSPDLALCLDAGEGALVDQALEAVGEDRAVEVPGGGTHFIESGFFDGVARGEAQDVPADQFLETFARLVLEDGGFGERVVRERLRGGAALARGGWLSESSHKIRPITVYKPWETRLGQPFAMVWIINGKM